MPRKKIPSWGVVAAVLFCCLCAALGAVLVCPKCGHEYEPGASVCPHCQAELPAAEPAAATAADEAVVAEPAPAAGEEGQLEEETAAREFLTASQYYEKKEYWLAYFFGRNAMALNALVSEARRGARYGQLLRLVENCRAKLRHVQRTCPVCGGTGQKTVQMLSLDGTPSQQKVFGPSCPCCMGDGYLRAWRSTSKIKLDQAKYLREYVHIQKRRGFEQLSDIWLPPPVKARLTVRSTVAMKKAFGSPCPACAGLGFSACTACGGAGKTKCSNPGCVGGEQVCPVCGGSGKERTTVRNTPLTRVCPRCTGSGRVVCDTCRGKTWLPCDPCKGTGKQLCTQCDGTGELPMCSRCEGQGLTTCSRCNGTGTDQGAPCPQCHGEGVVMCKSCQGWGRRR
ncbi:MAG: hypothetical protein JXR37_09715 [Kiritimatiellae bacterium]|nr:hypothetical protein [Kiritimatiellia bacterium]